MSVPGFEAIDEVPDRRSRFPGEVMIREIGPVQRVSADLEKLWRVPSVAAKERYLDSKVPGLNRNLPGIGVIAGDENRLRRGSLDRRELRAEIVVALCITVRSDDPATAPLE